MRAPRRREIYEAILHRLQNPTAKTVEDAAMGLTEDVIAAIVDMPDDPMLPQQRPLSLTLRGRDVAVTLDGSDEDMTFPSLDRVEKAALGALLKHALSLVEPNRANGGFISSPSRVPVAGGSSMRPGGYIAPTEMLHRHDPYGLDSGVGGE